MVVSSNWPAPAKINWFLHVTSRRPDGYHNIQTFFQFLELSDRLDFVLKQNRTVSLTGFKVAVRDEDNLAVRAAKLLQSYCGVKGGVEIHLSKNIPSGGGLGGGSSDAATVLVALNALWRLGLAESELINLGLQLGADVPVFISGCASWAEGVGDVLHQQKAKERYVSLLFPGVNVSTAGIFRSPELTRDSAPIKMNMDYLSEYRNDCEPVTKSQYPDVANAIDWLSRYGNPKMSGTGSSVFVAFDELGDAKRVASKIPKKWSGVACKTLNRSPLMNRLRSFNEGTDKE
ncbi:MAG: 4-(cytidine 5'-diphospho)-2-C-methyl-D-erythritol kinase [Pseudomonadota bacterium]|nr:4-(cytidine 5'-diphospho)-2-C-methyl-D-erythritol kinase [Pseudomonadota bacterium]